MKSICIYNNRKIKAAIMSIFLLTTIFSVFSSADNIDDANINLSYVFEKPAIKQIMIEKELYDEVILKDVSCFGNPGEPYLPVKGAYILLPQNSGVEKIIVESDQSISLGTGFNIRPVGELVPFSKVTKQISLKKEISIYNSDEYFPGKSHDVVGIYNFRGYQILVLCLYPVQYNPLSGELLYYTNIDVVIETKYQENNIMFRDLDQDKSEIMTKVDNPWELDSYQSTKGSLIDMNKDNYDVLILTIDDFKNGFQPLINAHEKMGLETKIKTLSDIAFNPDDVKPEDVRDFIRNEYLQSGISYVLIGGDIDIFPTRFVYVFGLDEETWFYETYMPSDIYYSCLDGSFNSDGDDDWGETTDGEDGGDVDLYAEVFIGRASVGDLNEVENFVTKTVDYLNRDFTDDYMKEYLFAGENLGDYGVASWGGNYLDLIIDGSTIDGYTTVGIPSQRYNIIKMYDRDNPWSKYDMIDYMNNGVHIINHDGHASYQYNMKMVIDDIVLIENDDYFFVYSSGCNSGGFDIDDCYAEYINVKTANGAFAVIMNARYGWFWSYSTDGDSTRYLREFWDAIFDEDISVISKANQDSKEDNIHLIGRSCMRWTNYGLNLFADPTVPLSISKKPGTPDSPLGPISGKTGKTYAYTVSTTDPDEDKIYYLFDWGDGTNSDWIGPYDSDDICEASYEWDTQGEYEVRVLARDSTFAYSKWSDSTSVIITKGKTLKKTLNLAGFEAEIGMDGKEESFASLRGQYNKRGRFIIISGSATSKDKQGRFQGVLKGNFFILQIPVRDRIINFFGRVSFNEDQTTFEGGWRIRGYRASGWIEGSLNPR
ncbi:MAG: hypothetical protein JSV67_01000 [Thermoplasmatales archaeon]|nr:MAG: hypothetical protein JSV67_01000 [Thermoplasmatales archaeon]